LTGREERVMRPYRPRKNRDRFEKLVSLYGEPEFRPKPGYKWKADVFAVSGANYQCLWCGRVAVGLFSFDLSHNHYPHCPAMSGNKRCDAPDCPEDREDIEAGLDALKKARKFKQGSNTLVYIPDEHWVCPKCGAGFEDGNGLMDDLDERETGKTNTYFYDQQLFCWSCNRKTSAGALFRAAVRKEWLVTCPHCKGTGLVPKSRG
jgi:hypothetical protein